PFASWFPSPFNSSCGGSFSTPFGSPFSGPTGWSFGSPSFGSFTPWSGQFGQFSPIAFGGGSFGFGGSPTPISAPIAGPTSIPSSVTGVPSTTTGTPNFNGQSTTSVSTGSPISPVSPITGNTPSTGTGLPNPTLNQGGFIPGQPIYSQFGGVPASTPVFGGTSGFGSFATPITSGYFPSQPFGFSGSLVTNGFGQPIFQQPFFPGSVPQTSPSGQFGGFQGPIWNGQTDSRTSGTTINVSQREAA
ncbi:MAG: hypothetical protein HRU13_06040, partial [Phycisphaerales bacterium]|nr:hypothetical protein [Phycisphaerales bacterium]